MPTNIWQLNPAMSIQDHVLEAKLVFGQSSAYSFSVIEKYSHLKSLCLALKLKSQFSKAEFVQIAESLEFPGPELLDDLIKLTVVIPYTDKRKRYSRHHYYFGLCGVTKDPQETLLAKSVLLIGVGGIGSTCAMLLAAAGVGNLILSDNDVLEESNLPRTILFNSEDVGQVKVQTARQRLLEKNGAVKIETLEKMLSKESYHYFENAFARADFVILSGDSGREVHELSYKLALEFNKPLINAGYIETFGVVGPTTIGANKMREQDLDFIPQSTELNSDLAAPSYGPLNSLVSSMAVNEVIRHFLGLPLSTLNRRILIDSTSYEIQQESWQ